MEIAEQWNSENSAVQNMDALIEEFYRVACSLPRPESNEDILSIDYKQFNVMNCIRCNTTHFFPTRFRHSIVKTLKTHLPEDDENLQVKLREFLKEIKNLDSKTYVQSHLEGTEAGIVINKVLAHQQDRISEYKNLICEGKASTNSYIGIVSCDIHGSHEVSVKYYKEFIRNVSQEKILALPDMMVDSVSGIARDVLKRQLAAGQRKFSVDLNYQRQATLSAENDNTHTSPPKKKQQPQPKKKKKKKKSFHKKSYVQIKPSIARLYILKPSLMSEDWLIEYNVCGRKTAYATLEAATTVRDENYPSALLDSIDVYSCPYCSQWHYGQKSHTKNLSSKRMRKKSAKNGLFWYSRNHKKANAFIHKIIFEEF